MSQVFEEPFIDPQTNEIFIKSLSPETPLIPLSVFLQLHNKLIQQYAHIYNLFSQQKNLPISHPSPPPLHPLPPNNDLLKCPISGQVMTNPVVDTITGVTFDYNSFFDKDGELLKNFPTIPHRIMIEEDLVPNHTLRKIMQTDYQLNLEDSPKNRFQNKLHPMLQPLSNFEQTKTKHKPKQKFQEKSISSKIVLTLNNKKGSVREHIYQHNPYVYVDDQGKMEYQRYEKIRFKSEDAPLSIKDCKAINICKNGTLHGFISNNNPNFFQQRTDLDETIDTIQNLVPNLFETLLDAATTCEKLYESKIAKTFVTFVKLHQDVSKLKENKIIILNAARSLLDHVWSKMPKHMRNNKNYRELISQFQGRVFDENAKAENAELIIFPNPETFEMVRLIIICNGDQVVCKTSAQDFNKLS